MTKQEKGYPLHKKWSFPLTISLVNVTKSAVFYGFGHIFEEIFNRKPHLLCSDPNQDTLVKITTLWKNHAPETIVKL